MPSILFKIARIFNSQINCNHLENEKLFSKFLFHFWNLHQILNILEEQMLVIANIIPKLQIVKTWLEKFLKSSVSQ